MSPPIMTLVNALSHTQDTGNARVSPTRTADRMATGGLQEAAHTTGPLLTRCLTTPMSGRLSVVGRRGWGRGPGGRSASRWSQHLRVGGGGWGHSAPSPPPASQFLRNGEYRLTNDTVTGNQESPLYQLMVLIMPLIAIIATLMIQ